MTNDYLALSFAAKSPERLGRFWAEILGGSLETDSRGEMALLPASPGGLVVRFRPWRERKRERNSLHFDLTSDSLTDQRRIVSLALTLGARPYDVGQRPEEGHVVLADLEGNEFCVIEPGNQFLAGCGPLGALACDGSREVGVFWSSVTGWPLVWDQNEETAIRSPLGGPKISWGGDRAKTGVAPPRLRFELTPPNGSEWPAEVARLIALGATRVDDERVAGGRRVVMADPDGQIFHVLTV